MHMTLAAPTSNDYAELARWIADANACLRWAGPQLRFPFAAAELPNLLAVPGGAACSHFLIDDSGRTCGFGQYWVAQPGAVHLGRIIVAPAVRGGGLGRQLCLHLIAAALRATRANTVTLRAYRDNTAAVTLYQSLGFIEDVTKSTDAVLFMSLHAAQFAG